MEDTTTNPVEGQQDGVTGVDEHEPLLDTEGQQEGQEGDQQPDDDTEEVEHEGQKHRIPKALKPLLLMQQDYTRKTQEAAEVRRAAEAAAQEAHAERTRLSAMNAEEIQARGTLSLYEQQLQRYQQINWQQLQQQDPDKAQAEFMNYQQLKDGHQALSGRLQQVESQRALDAQRFAAKQAEEGQAVLKRDIPGWGPELQQKVAAHTRSLGFSDAEIQGISDPRVVKVLHQAYQAGQLIRTKPGATQQMTPPAASTTLGSKTSPAREPRNESASEWITRRNKELRERKGR